MLAIINCNFVTFPCTEVMWSEASHKWVGEFRFVCGRFGHSDEEFFLSREIQILILGIFSLQKK